MLKIKKVVCVLGLIGTMIVGRSFPIFAADIYEQSLSEIDNLGFMSNINGDLSADNFMVTADSFLQSITWYGMYGSAGADAVDSFNVKIFNESGGQLFIKLDISDVLKSYSGFDDAYGQKIYQYQVSILNLAIPAGSYLLSISNSNSYFSDWFWADGLGGDGISYYLNSDSWVAENTSVDMAFVLTLQSGDDEDNDGIADYWEKERFGDLTTANEFTDYDFDGFSDIREFLSGSDPINNQDIPLIIADLDSDMDIDGLDLSSLIFELGRDDCTTLTPCVCDLDNDGDVDNIDLKLFGEDFGRP